MPRARATEPPHARLLTPGEACEMLGISEKTLRAHVIAGELFYISVGKGLCRERRMYDIVDLRQFIEARKTTCRSKSDQDRPSGTRASRSLGAAIFYLPERPAGRKPPNFKSGPASRQNLNSGRQSGPNRAR